MATTPLNETQPGDVGHSMQQPPAARGSVSDNIIHHGNDVESSQEVEIDSKIAALVKNIAELRAEKKKSAQGSEVNPIFAEMEAPWANSKAFIVDFIILLVLSAITGVASYFYSYVVGDCLNKWLTAVGDGEYPEAYIGDDKQFGCWRWIPLCWAGGTIVGILKFAIGLDEYDSFLVEIRDQHCDTVKGFKTCFCCMASLLSGAALGPEAGLAAFAAGLGTWFARMVADEQRPEEADERRRLFVVGGICAAFGTIMPSPWVSLLICVECSLLKLDDEGRTLTVFGRRTLFLFGMTAIMAYVVRYAVKEIPKMPNLAEAAEAMGETYDNLMVFKAIFLGAIAAFTALVYAIIQAVFKMIFKKIGDRLDPPQHRRDATEIRGAEIPSAEMRMQMFRKARRIIGLCSLAGLVTGVLGYLVPLSLSSGKEAMIPTIMHSGFLAKSVGGRLGTLSLLWIAIAKTASYSAAAAGGLVGGPFFPILYIGVVVGELCGRIPITWTAYAPTFTVPVVMVAVPSAVFPTPFTMVAIPLSYFHLGPLWCVPILAGIVTAYTLIVGSGLVKKLAKK